MSLTHIEMQILELGLLVLAAYFGGRIARKIHIGEVIGQILGGVLVGPHFLLLVSRWLKSHPMVEKLAIMEPVSIFFEGRFQDYASIMEGSHFFVFLFLGIVAFSLGEELHWNRLKQVGIRATVICIIQAFLTWAILAIGFHYFFKASWIVSLIIASIGIATAPALTFILMSKYKIEGRLKNILANIVVLDDVIEVIVFSITLGIAVGLKKGEHLSLFHVFHDVFLELGFAFLLGFILFAVLRFAIRNYNGDKLIPDETDSSEGSLLSTVLSDHPTPSVEILLIIIGVIAVIISVAMHFNLLFFGIIGASVQIETFSIDTLFLVMGYFILRASAKLGGNWIGCKITKQDLKITASIPRLMLPQAGMAAVETILVATVLGGQDGKMIFNTIVPALVIFELAGAYLSEQTLIRWKEWTAGEAEAARGEHSNYNNSDNSIPEPPLSLDILMPIPMQRISSEIGISKTEIIKKLIDSLYKEGIIEDVNYTQNAIIEREQLGSTVLIDGVALPHCRSESIDSPVVTGCFLESPVIWQIKPEKKVQTVFMIISPKQKPDEHLKALQTISHALKYGRFSNMVNIP